MIDDAYYDHELRIGTPHSIYDSYLSDKMVEFTGEYDKYSVQLLYCDVLPDELFNWYDTILKVAQSFRLKINILREIIPFILKTDGYCFLPNKIVKEYIEAGTLIEISLLDNTPPDLEFFIVVNKKRQHEEVISNFINYMMED